MAHQECLPGLAQTHERPRFTAVVAFPQAAPSGGVTPDTRRAHADVDHARLGIGHVDRSDGPAEILGGLSRWVVRFRPEAASRKRSTASWWACYLVGLLWPQVTAKRLVVKKVKGLCGEDRV